MIVFEMMITLTEIKMISMYLLNVCCILYKIKKDFITLQVFKGIGSQKKTMGITWLMWNYDLSDWIKRSILTDSTCLGK